MVHRLRRWPNTAAILHERPVLFSEIVTRAHKFQSALSVHHSLSTTSGLLQIYMLALADG